MENKTLTDGIYAELVDGLGKGLDWTAFIAKHNAHKPELYDAMGRFLNDMGPKIKALGEVQEKLDQSELKLDSLDQRTKEAEGNIAALEEKKSVFSKEVEAIETKLTEKGELAKHLAELTRLGFNVERLKQLRDALREIGAKHGLEGKEAVSQFFAELKDYDAKTDFEAEIQRLETITRTKKLEAENGQAKEKALRRKYDNLKEDIAAVRYLRTKNIKAGQLVVWQRILNQSETVEQFEESLRQYGDMAKFLNARKEETEACELRLAQAQSAVEALKKERAKIEGTLDALKVAGVNDLKAMAEATKKQIKAVAASEIKEAQDVGQEVRKEFGDFFAQLDALAEKVFELGQKWEGIKQEFQKYERVKNVLESHAAASEEVNEPIPK